MHRKPSLVGSMQLVMYHCVKSSIIKLETCFYFTLLSWETSLIIEIEFFRFRNFSSGRIMSSQENLILKGKLDHYNGMTIDCDSVPEEGLPFAQRLEGNLLLAQFLKAPHQLEYKASSFQTSSADFRSILRRIIFFLLKMHRHHVCRHVCRHYNEELWNLVRNLLK